MSRLGLPSLWFRWINSVSGYCGCLELGSAYSLHNGRVDLGYNFIGKKNGPVASNHGNLKTTANFTVLWYYGVPHNKVNGTE